MNKDEIQSKAEHAEKRLKHVLEIGPKLVHSDRFIIKDIVDDWSVVTVGIYDQGERNQRIFRRIKQRLVTVLASNELPKAARFPLQNVQNFVESLPTQAKEAIGIDLGDMDAVRKFIEDAEEDVRYGNARKVNHDILAKIISKHGQVVEGCEHHHDGTGKGETWLVLSSVIDCDRDPISDEVLAIHAITDEEAFHAGDDDS